jgi:hypothetical protein
VFAALVDTGYKVDSSVVPGLVLRDAIARVDYRGWRWPEKGRLIYDVYELPIATALFGPVDAFMRRFNPAPETRRGRSIRETSGLKPSPVSGLFRLYPLELGPSARRLQKIARRYLRRVGKDVEFAFSSHPKAVGEPELEALVAFHEWLDRNYDLEALSFRDLVTQTATETVG